MVNGKRWSVTYTKHIKQKRKVYQDGYLELETSANKITLYDDCEKLLGSRIVKIGDNVSPGETIAFDSYLVDIGEVDGGCAPVTSLNEDCVLIVKENFQQKNKKITETVGLGHGNRFRHNLLPSEDTKPILRKNISSSKLSPSQRIIQEFKKNELNKYGSPPDIRDATESNITEWQVLYTSQLTQKAKKYHDGNLKVVTSGSKGNQVMLYDASGRLLDSKFLRKNEVIASGVSLILDGYLVDIGEPEGGGHKPPSDPLNIIKVIEKAETGNLGPTKKRSPSNLHSGFETAATEWDVLYTTQVTQKAKRYNTGILRLAPCGSCRLKAALSSEDGTVLSCKFLKLSEGVRSGIIFQMPNYLVEVGDQRMREPEKIVCKKENLIPQFKRTIVEVIPTETNACTEEKLIPQFKRSIVDVIPNRRSTVDKPSHDEPEKIFCKKENLIPQFKRTIVEVIPTETNACREEKLTPQLKRSIVDDIPNRRSTVDKPSHDGKPESCAWPGSCRSSLKEAISTKIENIDKPLRDAQGILSILKKSMKPECSLPKPSLVDQKIDPNCSDHNHCDMKNLATREHVEDFDKDPTDILVTVTRQSFSGERDPINVQNYPADDEDKGDSKTTHSQGLEISDITKTDLDAGITSVLHDQLNAHVDGDAIQLMSLEEFSVKEISAEVRLEISSQSNADMRITPGTNLVNNAYHYPVNRKEKRAQTSLSEEEPFSFSLGF